MNDQEILGLAAGHYNAVAGEVKVGRWDQWAGVMREKIGSFQATREVLNYAQDDLPFGHRADVNVPLLSDCLSLLRDDFPWFASRLDEFSDEPESSPGTIDVLSKSGASISNMMLWHAWSLLTCLTHAPKVRSVLEIGGGFGAFARLWGLNFPLQRYVVVDIPESLYFAEVCLRRSFGDDVGYFVDSDPGAKFLLVPHTRLDSYTNPSDMVVSIGSLQEMTDTCVSGYMAWLDRYDAKWFYSLNYAAHSANLPGESRCFWATRPSPGWRTKVLSVDPAVIRIMCPGRRFLASLYYKENATGSLADWSVLRGRALNYDTYVEGLDLVRQAPSKESIKLFVTTVLDKGLSCFILAKELVFLAHFLEGEMGRRIIDIYKSADKEIRA